LVRKNVYGLIIIILVSTPRLQPNFLPRTQSPTVTKAASASPPHFLLLVISFRPERLREMRLVPFLIVAWLAVTSAVPSCPSGYTLDKKDLTCYSDEQLPLSALSYSNCCPSSDTSCQPGSCPTCTIQGNVTAWWTQYVISDPDTLTDLQGVCSATGKTPHRAKWRTHLNPCRWSWTSG